MPTDEPLGSLGWRNGRSPDDADVAEIRDQLIAEAGIERLDDNVVHPDEPGYAERAAEIFAKDGVRSPPPLRPTTPPHPPHTPDPALVRQFVVVKKVLDAERLARIKYGMDQVIRLMVETDPGRDGNRGSHRYSFGSANAHFGAPPSTCSSFTDPTAPRPPCRLPGRVVGAHRPAGPDPRARGHPGPRLPLRQRCLRRRLCSAGSPVLSATALGRLGPARPAARHAGQSARPVCHLPDGGGSRPRAHRGAQPLQWRNAPDPRHHAFAGAGPLAGDGAAMDAPRDPRAVGRG